MFIKVWLAFTVFVGKKADALPLLSLVQCTVLILDGNSEHVAHAQMLSLSPMYLLFNLSHSREDVLCFLRSLRCTFVSWDFFFKYILLVDNSGQAKNIKHSYIQQQK